jgi:hypothetical protein
MGEIRKSERHLRCLLSNSRSRKIFSPITTFLLLFLLWLINILFLFLPILFKYEIEQISLFNWTVFNFLRLLKFLLLKIYFVLPSTIVNIF